MEDTSMGNQKNKQINGRMKNFERKNNGRMKNDQRTNNGRMKNVQRTNNGRMKNDERTQKRWKILAWVIRRTNKSMAE